MGFILTSAALHRLLAKYAAEGPPMDAADARVPAGALCILPSLELYMALAGEWEAPGARACAPGTREPAHSEHASNVHGLCACGRVSVCVVCVVCVCVHE